MDRGGGSMCGPLLLSIFSGLTSLYVEASGLPVLASRGLGDGTNSTYSCCKVREGFLTFFLVTCIRTNVFLPPVI
jgi:hypothetical protein